MKFEKELKKIIGEKIDFYGEKENYIHLKFGDCRKTYNFTDEFAEKYLNFVEEYNKYFLNIGSIFKNILDVVNYVIMCDLPVYFYKNFSDEVCLSQKEIYDYIINEYIQKEAFTFKKDENDNKYYYYDLDNNKIEK